MRFGLQFKLTALIVALVMAVIASLGTKHVPPLKYRMAYDPVPKSASQNTGMATPDAMQSTMAAGIGYTHATHAGSVNVATLIAYQVFDDSAMLASYEMNAPRAVEPVIARISPNDVA